MLEWPLGIGDTRFITVVRRTQRPFVRGEIVLFNTSTTGRIAALDGTGLPLGEILDEDTVLKLRHTLEKNLPYIAEVAQASEQDDRCQVQVSWPAQVIPMAGAVQVVLSSKARKALQSRVHKDFATDLDDWLKTNFVYHGQYLVFYRDPENPDIINLLSPHTQLRCEMRGASFLWVVSSGRLPKKNLVDVFARAGLIQAPVEWLTSKAEVPEAAKGALDLLAAITAKNPYFEIWQQYHDLEQQMLVAQVIALQPVAYQRLKYYDDVIRFYLDRSSDTTPWRDLGGNLSVEVVVPARSKRRRAASDADEEVRAFPLGSVRRIERDFIDVDRSDDELGLPSRGKLRASAVGDEVRLARQQAALAQLQTGVLPIRNLAQLLSTGDTTDVRAYTIPAFTTHPPRMANGRPPHDRQARAVEMALNTPDICAIQGPPGTGKTTVIRTIVRRLKDEGRRHLLISSHQHSAVDKALDGLQESGVVSFRYGGNANTEAYQSRELAAWVDQVTQQVQSQLAALESVDPQYGQRAQLHETVEGALSASANLINAQRLLGTLPRKYAEILPAGLAQQAQLLLIELTSLIRSQQAAPPALTIERFEAKLQELPANAVELDDTLVLGQLLTEVERLVTDGRAPRQLASQMRSSIGKIGHLQSLVRFGDDSATALVDLQLELETFRALAQSLVTNPESRASGEQPGLATAERAWLAAFYDWCRAVADQMARDNAASAGQIPQILKEWVEGLNTRPAKVRELFGKHADVWGVTCQQTVAGRFGLYDTEFDYVIIDEAARTGPLDLLIPLVRARCIILVGDHKQLPHALEYRLEKEFEKAAGSAEHRNLLKASLFQRLYDNLPASKKIRLNHQYRMHPVIGKMISRVFYDDDPLESDDSTSKLVNDTALFTGHALVWVNVAPQQPGEKLEEGLYSNPAEARLATHYVSQLINANSPYNIGVITYYAQQRDRIERDLQAQVPGAHQVQVGSVDAFQGEEKDIIILSMVRSNPDHRIGFINPNRLNVSLSRARRLLIILGDAATMTASPQLKAVYEYCEEMGSVIPSV